MTTASEKRSARERVEESRGLLLSRSCTKDNAPVRDGSAYIGDAILALCDAVERRDAPDAEQRHLPCGCVVCICEEIVQCHGCGAKTGPKCDAGGHWKPPSLEQWEAAQRFIETFRQWLNDTEPNRLGLDELAAYDAAMKGEVGDGDS